MALFGKVKWISPVLYDSLVSPGSLDHFTWGIATSRREGARTLPPAVGTAHGSYDAGPKCPPGSACPRRASQLDAEGPTSYLTGTSPR